MAALPAESGFVQEGRRERAEGTRDGAGTRGPAPSDEAGSAGGDGGTLSGGEVIGVTARFLFKKDRPPDNDLHAAGGACESQVQGAGGRARRLTSA